MIVLSHFDRPKGKVVPSMSLKPVVAPLARAIGRDVAFADDCVGEKAEAAVKAMKDGALVCNSGGRLTVAAGADITFVTSARLGDVLVAEGHTRAAYGRSGLTDVTVTRESDGAVVAEFRGRSRSLRG